ncbi:hypothetical protein [Arthrobacter sp. GMC3]|uniref:hypothetical protein n=1 Tax=Arthrobacter sp. GMC3 TaxID=2058894 RepID=UPI0011B0DC1A|nr:hypothetical protein [Arthrobacter sp. GMC3]
MRKPQPLPWQLSQPFTLTQARNAGLGRSRTRAADLWTPSREIRLPSAVPFSLLENCRAHIRVTPASVVSHSTAATIHGLYLPRRFENEQDLHLSSGMGTCRPQRKHVIGHELLLGRGDVVITDGVPVTSVQRTLLDMAPLLSVEELVVVADQIVCAHHYSFTPAKIAMVELNTLNDFIAQHAGMRGMRKLRAAMELVRVCSDSPPETRLRLLLGRSSLPNFDCNIELVNSDGKGMVAPDLVCRKYRTCAEYDGLHHFSAAQQSKDHDRDFITGSLGWHQVLLNNNDMANGALVVVTKVARMLVRGGWHDPQNLAGRSLRGELHTRKDFA